MLTTWFLCQYLHFPIVFARATTSILEKEISQALTHLCHAFFFFFNQELICFEYSFADLFFPISVTCLLAHVNTHVCFSKGKSMSCHNFTLLRCRPLVTHKLQDGKQASREKKTKNKKNNILLKITHYVNNTLCTLRYTNR